MIRIVILGGGNVAYHLTNAFLLSKEIEVVQHYNRTLSNTNTGVKNITDDLAMLAEAEVYILCIPDDAIADFSNKIPAKNALLVHTSGSVALTDLNSNFRRGVFYPLQTFSKKSTIAIETVPFCLEAENKTDEKLLKKLVKSIGASAYVVNSQQRKILHLSAVFVNNFVNHLYYIGLDICEENKLPFSILEPLIQETSQKILKTSPFKAQTGPAIRNDVKTLKGHSDLLHNSNYKEIYNLFTKSIQETYGKKL